MNTEQIEPTPERRPRGRPSRPMPERIDASPEEIADVVMRMPRKTKWRYLERQTQDEQEPDL